MKLLKTVLFPSEANNLDKRKSTTQRIHCFKRVIRVQNFKSSVCKILSIMTIDYRLESRFTTFLV